MWWFDNTTYIRSTTNFQPSAFIWASGPTHNIATNPPVDRLGTISNGLFANNLILNSGYRNNACVMQFPTNIAPNYVNFSGFEYKISDMVVDYNAVSGFTGNGNGFMY